MPSFVQSFLALPPRIKGIAAVSTVAVLGVAFLLLRIASAPSYQILASGIDPAQTGKATAALDAAGVTYQLRNNGTALAVAGSEVGPARVALATSGVSLSGANDGFALFDKQKLGASDFQQQVTYQRALEGQIANTIDGVAGVSNAQVSLVLPKDDLFASTSSPATAAVMLGNTADSMGPGAVSGIAQLVSSSVQGLKSDKVTITDSSGALLWPQAGAADGTGGTGTSKASAESRYDANLEARLDAMLDQTLGAGKAQAQVNADLNVDKTTKDQLVYNKKGVPTEVTTDNENLKGAAPASGGTTGTAANVPTYAAGTTAAGAGTKYTHKVKTTKQAIGKQVIRTDVAAGSVNHLNVALVIDKSVPPAVASSLKNTIASAAGVTPKRGDVITMSQFAFAKPAVPKAGPVPTSLLGPLKWVGLGIASLVFLFFMTRALRKREGEQLVRPSWLTEIEEPVSIAELEQRTSDGADAPTIVLPPRQPDTNLKTLDQLMEREPERVAAQVKQWISQD
jgi:flagellar M-ring protein FliF